MRWSEIDPADATTIDVRDRPDIEGPLTQEGKECPWPWEPQQLKNAPMGQYHCNYCGEMVMAGLPHFDYRAEYEYWQRWGPRVIIGSRHYPPHAPYVHLHRLRHRLIGPLIGCSCSRCFRARWRARISPTWTYRAVREYKSNLTWRGLEQLLRARWRELLLDPREQYGIANAMSTGAFT